MKKFKLKFANLEIYTYIILFIFIVSSSIFFYKFINKNVYAIITTSEVPLDAASIRISDVNIPRFKEVLLNINNKSMSTKVNTDNFFN